MLSQKHITMPLKIRKMNEEMLWKEKWKPGRNNWNTNVYKQYIQQFQRICPLGIYILLISFLATNGAIKAKKKKWIRWKRKNKMKKKCIPFGADGCCVEPNELIE